mgnify:CR=1 FL=1
MAPEFFTTNEFPPFPTPLFFKILFLMSLNSLPLLIGNPIFLFSNFLISINFLFFLFDPYTTGISHTAASKVLCKAPLNPPPMYASLQYL